MHPAVQRVVDWIRRRAENVVVALLGVMFVAFLIQIVFRYFFNFPVGWATELSVVAWLYIVLVGSALWLKEGEEIQLDLVTAAVGPRVRRVIVFCVSIAAVVLFGMALPATVKYVTFMKVESSSYLNIRMDVLFSVYVLFAAAVIVRYAWLAWTALSGQSEKVRDIANKGHGL